ncbi:acetoacetate decarboxylase family protein [Aquabacterium sp.]|uniref:acetoacetate decarboxylase family protein n=1 Tax=Aquabacterium sp. TaxID=1872578 RepID=UPI0035AF89E7
MRPIDDPFFDCPRTTLPTSEGEVDFPILYLDTSTLVAGFWVDAEAARACIKGQGLRLAMTLGSRAMVMMAFYNYRVTTVGSYNEVGLAIPVVPENAPAGTRWMQALTDVDSPKRDLGYYVVHLPVTTAAANAAGREAWGLPKFVTPIDFTLQGREVTMRVRDPERPGQTSAAICELSGSMGLGVPGPSIGVVLYSQLNGQKLRATVNVRGGGDLHLPGSLRLSVGASAHPMARTLRELGLHGARPVWLSATHKFQSRLNLGVPYA